MSITKQSGRFWLAATAASFALVLSACNGGGSGLPSAASQLGSAFSQDLTKSATAISAATSVTPVESSVVQSSEGTVSSLTVNYKADGSDFTLTLDDGTVIGTADADTETERIQGIDVQIPWEGVELAKAVSGGTLYVDVYVGYQSADNGGLLLPGRGILAVRSGGRE